MLLEEEVHNKFKNILNIYEGFSTDKLYEDLELFKDKTKILKLSNDIMGTKFKIAIIGEFSTGKSTIINSLVQKDILPAKYKPTTNQITIIKDSKDEYVRVSNQPNSSLELTKENVSKLDNYSKENIEIGVKLPNLANYEIYDTPGVNDPSMFSDEIVFDLIGKVDVVVFTMHATQVLKQSEIDFLTKLIRKKDISKFFFIINQTDLIGDEQYSVKDDFLEKLSNLLKVSKSNLAEKTFLYSAKKCLEGIEKSDGNLLKEFGYDAMISGVDEYIKSNKNELFKEIVDRKLSLIIKDTLIKIDTLKDKIDNKDKEYENALKAIEKEISNFHLEIEDAIFDFRKDFDKQKAIFKKRISTSFDAIAETMAGEVSSLPVEKISKDRYVEIRTKKLIEDVTNEEFTKFAKNLQINFEKFNTNIQPIYNQKSIAINDLVTKNYASTVVTGVALGGAVIGGITYIPTILSLGIGAIGVSAIGGLAGAIPGIGGAIAGSLSAVVSTATTLAIHASKVAFDLAKWGVKGIGEFSNKAEDILKVKQYQKSIKNSIDEIKKTILENIDKELQSATYIELFIEEKFPQKEELQKKIELSQKEFSFKIQDGEDIKARLEGLYIKLQAIL